MVSKFMVHKEVYNKWPAKGEKPSGESFVVDLIDMSEPAEHSYRGMLPYRLTPEEKTKYWGKLERREVNIGVHSILATPRGPVLKGAIVSVEE